MLSPRPEPFEGTHDGRSPTGIRESSTVVRAASIDDGQGSADDSFASLLRRCYPGSRLDVADW